MKRKQMVIIGLILAIILSYYIIKIWLADGDQIREVSKIQESNLLLAISDDSKAGNWLHKIRYKSNINIEGKVLAFDENGNIHTVAKVDNGYIDNFWINSNRLYILYNSGKSIYNNKSDKMKCISYSLTEKNEREVKLLDNHRIWGLDSVIGELLIDKKNIEFESGLTSNIYCDEEKRLYVDGNKLIEYSRDTDINRSVLQIPLENHYSEIGYLKNKDHYVLICDNQLEYSELIILDSDYKICLQKKLDFQFSKTCIGSDYLIGSDENNNLVYINSDGLIKGLPVDNTADDIIQSISYDAIEGVYYILTNRKLISLDIKTERKIKESEFINEIYGIRDVIVLP